MTSTSRGVNYDLIAQIYDEPGRDYAPDPDLIRFLRERSYHPLCRVLDMGCGTGKQLTADHKAFHDLQMVGLDLFYGMLQQAQQRCDRVSWVQADGMQAPFAEATFNYITNQFSYHHVRDKRKLFAEAYRILQYGGRLAMTDLDPWSMPMWIVYRYFPAAWRRDTVDFLPACELTSMMEQIGFSDIRIRRQTKPSYETLEGFLAYVAERHRTSQLIAISDHEYEKGIARLKQFTRRHGSLAQVASEICLVWITADKRALERPA